MNYEVVFTEDVSTRRRVYAYVEADSREDVREQINEGNYEVEDCTDCYDTDWELVSINSVKEVND